MWSKQLERPVWLEDRENLAAIWRARAKRLVTFILAACDPRLGSSSGEDAVAWLTGLRGVAAFLVYCDHHHHFIPHGDQRLEHSFGYGGEYYYGSLPLVRFFFTGGGKIAVALFFTISGYVLSYSPLRLIQLRPEGLDMASKIGTSFARRWLRLFLPVIVVTFAFMASWHLFNVQSGCVKAAAPTSTFREETARWLRQFLAGSYVSASTDVFGSSNYSPHMWTIGVEYRGSILIYVSVLAYFALRYTPRTRFWIALGFFLYFQCAVPGYYYAAFVMGMLICDLTIVSELNPSQLPKLFKWQFFKTHTWIYYIMFLAGIYLASVPHTQRAIQLQEEPGWYLLARLVPFPQDIEVTWYYVNIGAALIITSIPHIRWLRGIFDSAPIQYLGKVSFAFYLVHGPLLWTVGDRLYAAVGQPPFHVQERIPTWVNWFPISNVGPLGMELNAMLVQVIMLPLTLWLAAVVTKLVDTPSVRLSKYLFTPKKLETEKSSAASWETEPMLPPMDGRLPR